MQGVSFFAGTLYLIQRRDTKCEGTGKMVWAAADQPKTGLGSPQDICCQNNGISCLRGDGDG